MNGFPLDRGPDDAAAIAARIMDALGSGCPVEVQEGDRVAFIVERSDHGFWLRTAAGHLVGNYADLPTLLTWADALPRPQASPSAPRSRRRR